VEITDSVTQNPQPDGSYYLDGAGEILLGDVDPPVMLFQPHGAQVYYDYEWNGIGFPT
jgi:hypothetical protein